MRDRLGGPSQVLAVDVRAFPAIELLWQHAGRVAARVRTYDTVGVDVAGELASTSGVDELDVRIARVHGPDDVILSDVRLRKRDGLLTARAVVSGAELSAALGRRFSLALVPARDDAVVVAGRLGGAPIRLRVVAQDGRVIARPDGALGLLARYPVFSDPRIDVEHVGARLLPGGRFLLTAAGRVS